MTKVKDLTGQVFGNWTVISRDESKKDVHWRCQCECGYVRSVSSFYLFNETLMKCKLCGNARKEPLDLSGKHFGKWVVLHLDAISKLDRPKRRMWICQCECGNLQSVSEVSLYGESFTTCDICRSRENTVVSIMRDARRTAKRRGILWELSKEDVRNLIFKNCAYCGSPPYQVQGRIITAYNGIDRINNDIGYRNDNCVPCCKFCNWMKSDMSKQNFLGHVKKIATNLQDNGGNSEYSN